MKTSYAAFLICGAAAFTSACGSFASDYCDLKCECEVCSDQDYDECVADVELQQEVASVYECDDEMTELEDCVIESSTCTPTDDGARLRSGDQCRPREAEIAECVQRSSAIRDGD